MTRQRPDFGIMCGPGPRAVTPIGCMTALFFPWRLLLPPVLCPPPLLLLLASATLPTELRPLAAGHGRLEHCFGTHPALEQRIHRGGAASHATQALGFPLSLLPLGAQLLLLGG